MRCYPKLFCNVVQDPQSRARHFRHALWACGVARTSCPPLSISCRLRSTRQGRSFVLRATLETLAARLLSLGCLRLVESCLGLGPISFILQCTVAEPCLCCVVFRTTPWSASSRVGQKLECKSQMLICPGPLARHGPAPGQVGRKTGIRNYLWIVSVFQPVHLEAMSNLNIIPA